jgi:hypothetical protein
MRRLLFLVGTLLFAAACAGAANVSSLAPSQAATPAATATPAPTPSPAPSPTAAAPTSIASVVYPYGWALPPKIAVAPWRAATAAWNGIDVISSDAAYMDRTTTIDGALFVFGTAWKGSLDEFKTDMIAKFAYQHDCTMPTTVRTAQIDGAKAVAFAQSCAGLPVTRVITLNAGTGMVIWEFVGAAKQAVALDDLVSWLDAWKWSRS